MSLGTPRHGASDSRACAKNRHCLSLKLVGHCHSAPCEWRAVPLRHSIFKPVQLGLSFPITPLHVNGVLALRAIPYLSPSIWACHSRAFLATLIRPLPLTFSSPISSVNNAPQAPFLIPPTYSRPTSTFTVGKSKWSDGNRDWLDIQSSRPCRLRQAFTFMLGLAWRVRERYTNNP
ncbi:hypothetical protein AVEN_161035-1 [Araneus ventricosus]|uniref:Uncharacterized protein n=1 Tax=Araneus ventricosus TaxID=182803 RepID=A0A4Y2F6G1_ARAVE|nr:hypothetical protein AVEN_161035-1 [Araneus ventricosus]